MSIRKDRSPNTGRRSIELDNYSSIGAQASDNPPTKSLVQVSCYGIHILYKGHSMSNQLGILGHLLDFDETWCVCTTYGAHHPYQLLTTYIT